MALPQKFLVASTPTLPQFVTKDGQMVPGVDDPGYLITLKQLPYMQMTRLLDQLSEFSICANELFLSLGNQSIRIADRINNLSAKVDALNTRVPQLVQSVVNSDLKPFNRERNSWKSSHMITSNLFTKATQPLEITGVYNTCFPPPPLAMLDQFRTDGLSCMQVIILLKQLFSYPEFFVEEWKLLMKKEHDGKKTRKRQKSVDLTPMTRDKMDSAEPATPTGLISAGPGKGRERVKVSDARPASQVPAAFSQPEFKPPPAKAAPPPMMNAPAPPPPPNKAAATPTTPGAPPGTAPKPAPVAQESEVGFLSDIRGKQFQLRKAQVITKEERKKQNEPEGVAAILMRRAAVEESDSGEEEDDGDEWN